MKVRANSVYTFDPVPWDQIDPPYGVQQGILERGDRVTVKNLPGCPKANTMSHCHIQTMSGEFAGLVHVNSLVRS